MVSRPIRRTPLAAQAMVMRYWTRLAANGTVPADQEDVIAEELASLLFQLEVFEDVPGVGAATGALFNLAFVRRVDVTARRVFQERWLKDHGKVERIEPAGAHPRALATGWAGALSRASYTGCYYAGFGATFPFWLVASVFGSFDNALLTGMRDGAAAAAERSPSRGCPSTGAPTAQALPRCCPRTRRASCRCRCR